MSNFFKDHKSKFLIFGALAGAVAAGYLYLRKEHKKSLMTEKFREALKSEAKIETTPEGYYSINTLLFVKNKIWQAGLETFSAALFINRKTRRFLVKTNEEYIKCVVEYMNEMDVVTKNLEDEILNELHMSSDLFTKSHNYYAYQIKSVEYFSELMKMSIISRIELETKSRFDNARDLHIQLQNFVEVIKKNEKNIADLRKALKNNPRASQILRKKIFDYIFAEYGLEEEEIMKDVAKFASDIETRQLNEHFVSVVNVECKGALA